MKKNLFVLFAASVFSSNSSSWGDTFARVAEAAMTDQTSRLTFLDKYTYVSYEIVASIGSFYLSDEAIKLEEVKREKEKNVDTHFFPEKDAKFKGNLWALTRLGLSARIGLGVPILNVGLFSSWLFGSDSSTLKLGVSTQTQYKDFLVRLAVGLNILSSYNKVCPDSLNRVSSQAVFGHIQLGYFFHPNFYGSVILEYNRGVQIVSEQQPMSSGFAAYLALGYAGGGDELIQDVANEAKVKKLAELEAEEEFKEKLAQKKAAKKEVEEKAKRLAELEALYDKEQKSKSKKSNS